MPVLGPEDGVWRARGADNDVGAAGRLIKLLKLDDFRLYAALKILCQPPRALGSAVAHQDCAGSLLHQVTRSQFAHFARADQEDRASFERPEDLARQVDGHRGDGHGIRSDSCFAASLFGGGKGALKQLFQLPGDRTRSPRDRKRLFHLAQNLRLAHHHGIKARGHAEQVAYRFLVAVLVEVRTQI